MASFTGQFGQFRPYLRGIREVLHNDGVHAMLAELASAGADEACSAAEGRRSPGNQWREAPPYRWAVDEGRYTSIGVVFTASAEGRRDQLENHTLDSLNH